MSRPPANRPTRAVPPPRTLEERRRTLDKTLSPRRRRVFQIISVLLPLVVLGLGELACRASGWGGYPPVLQKVGEDGGRTWYATSRRATNKYFRGGNSLTGGMRELQFRTPKRPGTVRILFLGESAVQGFPQPLPITNGAFLEAMLRDAWHGERSVEVLNLGATAVASFPVGYFLDAALEHEPDLVVLMVGNNEYYGAYGVASLSGAARSPGGMRVLRAVRGLGLVQWFESLLGRRAPPSRSLMEQLAGKQQIPPASPLRQAAATSLQAHMTAMVQRCIARHVPVIVCTVPTNERGLAPIGFDAERPAADEAALDRAAAALTSDAAGATDLARAAIAGDSTNARAHFILGQALTALGQNPAALAEYVRARDLDIRPWRATSAANNAVRSAAAAGATLCDMEGVFRAASPGGAVGWELMDDHVHMSWRGQALFARTIAATLASMPEPLRVRPEDLAALPDWETYAERLGHSVYTDYVAASYMRNLFDIGFMKHNNAAAFEHYDTWRTSLLAGMTDLDRSAVERQRDPSLPGAAQRPLEFVVGVYRMGAGDFATAARLFRVAQASVATVSLWRLECTWHLLTCNRRLHDAPTPEDAALCQEAIRIGELLERFADAKNPEAMRFLGLAYNLAGNFPAAITRLEPAAQTLDGTEGWEVVAALADSYQQLGRAEDARRILRAALAKPAMAEPARRMLSRIEGAADRVQPSR